MYYLHEFNHKPQITHPGQFIAVGLVIGDQPVDFIERGNKTRPDHTNFAGVRQQDILLTGLQRFAFDRDLLQTGIGNPGRGGNTAGGHKGLVKPHVIGLQVGQSEHAGKGKRLFV